MNVCKISQAKVKPKKMAAGIYEEPLPCGGKLKVSKTSWKISYYFQGPDFRYNGSRVRKGNQEL